MSAQADMQRAFSLIRQLQGALGGLEIRVGRCASNGVVDYADTVTGVHNATGDYTLTFDPAFRSDARVIGMAGSTSGPLSVKQKTGTTASPSSFSLYAFNTTTGSLADSDFWFIAFG